MNQLPPLIIGEVLFDHFPDGEKVLGGAPFNVAWNLKGLGLDPLFLSAVGSDIEGIEIKDKMNSWGMNTTGLQVSETYPTGQVQVTFPDGQPAYEIVEDQAYDHIEFQKNLFDDEKYSLFYTGTLAYRSEKTRSTIRTLIKECPLSRFIDINIRKPWFEESWLDDLVPGTRWVKINDEELTMLTGQPCSNSDETQKAVSKFQESYGGEEFYVTCGSKGVYAIDSNSEIHFVEAVKPEPFVDSVGAGDAFASATISSIIQGKNLTETLSFASQFASKVCTLQGATTSQQEFYRNSH